MRNRLFWTCITFLAVGMTAAAGGWMARAPMAQAAPGALLGGCTDVPEAVALAETLRLRGIAVDRVLADLDRRKDDLATVEQQLIRRLTALKQAKASVGDARAARDSGTAAGIERLIAVYDAMKPADAAMILTALPPDFAAEILARVQPDAGARIIARIEPGHAAVLTAHMGSRRLSGN
ncbi:MAG TPA: hypothetical protein GX686_03100 [Paracoccus sp.]|nr:hypothetical protein [Paracoccus sp. (in: a-proteobacteria)]